jgi:hypothetical protein
MCGKGKSRPASGSPKRSDGRRIQTVEVVLRASCPTRKRPLDADEAAEDARRRRLRAYRCPACGAWHLTKRKKFQPRVVKLSAAECREVWSL